MSDLLHWDLGTPKAPAGLVWYMARASMRARMGRAVLTVATVATTTAFVFYLLARPGDGSASARDEKSVMLALALLVATAGVLNTMLMTVSERYREIGTLKCLGALDGFILRAILLEAAFVGAVGAGIGLVTGAALLLVLGLAESGTALFSRLSAAGVLGAGGIAIGIGIGLTAFGAFLPAAIAARMPPIEAMRGEK